jgi:hypothetical protein
MRGRFESLEDIELRDRREKTEQREKDKKEKLRAERLKRMQAFQVRLFLVEDQKFFLVRRTVSEPLWRSFFPKLWVPEPLRGFASEFGDGILEQSF